MPQAGEGSSQLGVRTVAMLRGWEEMIVRQSDSPEEAKANALIDVDGAPRDIESDRFENLNEVEAGIAELQAEARAADVPHGDIIRQKLDAARLHVRIRRGEHIPFHQHLKTAMGVDLEWVSDTELEARRSLLNQLLPEGMEHRAADKEAFESEFVLKTPEEIQRAIEGGFEAGAELAGRFFRVQNRVEPQAVNDANPWSGWVSTDKKGELYFKYNLNPAYKYTGGEAATLGGHELLGHVEQLQTWIDAVQAGDMDPSLVVTTPQTPECTPIEAVGQMAGALLVDRTVTGVNYQIAYDDYKTAVFNNVSYLVNTLGKEHDARTLQYAVARLPFEEEDHLRNVMENRRDPLWRAYLACYRKGALVTRAVMAMSPDQQQIVVPALYQPLTVAQMDEIMTVTATRND